MDRMIDKYLLSWKNENNRKPLIVRGARQIGKSFALSRFGRENFEDFVEINFEVQKNLIPIFNALNPHEILQNLNLSLNANIIPGKTFLFLDEIQECPQAITAMRYFYERMPELHVAGAGSLLDFCLTSEKFNAPVGRIQYIYMYPLSFSEFLKAMGEENILGYLNEITVNTVINPAVHQKALKLLREYLIIGGMPAVIKEYLASKISIGYQKNQLSILQTYRDDFGKYANRVRHIYLQKVFDSAPLLAGQHYKYVNVDKDIPSRELKNALDLLIRAGIITKICAVSAAGLPFMAHCNENKFKIIFLDVGLMQRACGLDAKLALADDFLCLNKGAVAEQFVGQELLAYSEPYERGSLYFWKRENKNSSAEVDYVMQSNAIIIPIEVKSGTCGTLKSMKIFMQENKSKLGVRYSQLPLSFHNGILSIPLYAVEQMPRLVNELILN